MLRAALAYAERYAVFPCKPHGKTPLTEHGFKSATRDPSQIREWWELWPEANIGIATGAISGIVVLDIDPRHGGDDTLATLEARYGKLLATPTALTGGGGRHKIFEHPGGHVPNSAGTIGAGIDLRGDGGYVIAPPSVHPSGEVYRWRTSAGINELTPSPLPEWALDPVVTNGERSANGNDGSEAPTGFDLLHALGGVPEGQRNDQIFRAACSFRGTNTARKVALQACLDAAAKCTPPYSSDAAREIVMRAYRVYRADDSRPEILILPGCGPDLVDAAEAALLGDAPRLGIFQRGGEIVRVTRLGGPSDERGLRRPGGNVQLAPVSTLNLLETFDRLIFWQRPARKDGEGPRPADCPPKIAATYLARVGEWQLPPLVGVVEAPIVRGDGSILNAPGYDEASGLYLFTPEQWPPIPDTPTRADAESALRTLLEPFSEFPFVDDSARSGLLAAILTAIQRRLLESAPLFAFDAPAQRSGKSLLAESLGMLAVGRKPTAIGVAKDADEFRKAITSALREGQSIVNLDNLTHPLGSPDLARAITQSEYGDRLLGANQMLRLPTNLTWTVTGNNLTFHDDLPSRTLVCRIDAGVERPEERTFAISNLPVHLLDNRKSLVAAALTILRAFHIAGRPDQNLRPWGGFDDWSRTIREPLVWLGMADPCRSRERVLVNDPDRDLAITVLEAWSGSFRDRAVTSGEVIRNAGDSLKDALLQIAANKNDFTRVDARRLGAWCRSVEDRVFGGFRLARDGESGHAALWRVSCVCPGTAPEPPASAPASNAAREPSAPANGKISAPAESNLTFEQARAVARQCEAQGKDIADAIENGEIF